MTLPITLQDLSADVPDNRVVFLFSDTTITYGELRQKATQYRSQLDIALGKNVVIYGWSRQEFVLLLYFLDGIAKRILFLPADIEQALYQDYCRQADIELDATYDLTNGICLTDVETASADQRQTVADKFDTEWIIPTSGTTKLPKLVAHNLQSLTRTLKSDVSVGQHFTWGLIYDVYRFAGIQVFLQALVAGSPLAIPKQDLTMSESLAFFAKSGCNTLSATPSFWRKALMTPELKSLELVNITLGGEISDASVLKSLNQMFPAAKIRHIYASTEAGVGFSVNDGQAGFPASYLNGGLQGVDLMIKDGLLWLKPAQQNQHYLSEQEMYEDDGYINTGDLVEIKEDRVFFLGRESGAINVGGNKVQPEEVEKCILESGLVSQAVVYAKTSSMMGSLVMADIVLLDQSADSKDTKKQVLEFCKENLAAFKVPAMLKVVQNIQITQSGKIKRR